MRFVCPCCGHRTLPDRPGTLAALCEVCGWEGRDGDGWLRDSADTLRCRRAEGAPAPRGHGVAPPWQQLTVDALDRYHWGPFSFMDARGIRYYTPALLRLDLQGRPPGALESLVYTLTDGHRLPALRALLDDAQRRVIARYFLHRAQAPDWMGARTARAALRVWGADLDDDERALLTVDR